MKMINILLSVAIFALLIASGYLIYYNASNEVYSKILPVIVLGLGTVIATIYFSAKETKSQKTFENVIFFDGETNMILHPEDVDLPKHYDNLFSPNQSSNPQALSGYIEKASKLDQETVFDFYGYINASIIFQIFTHIREENKRLMSPDLFSINYDEDLDIPKLKLTYKPLSQIVEIAPQEFKGNFSYMPGLEEPMPENIHVKFIATSPQSSLTGAREMVIYRKNFFEFHLRSEVHQASFGKKGYFTIRLTNTVKFEKLTSQHGLTKVYKAYCQSITNMVSERFNNPKLMDEYIPKIRAWSMADH